MLITDVLSAVVMINVSHLWFTKMLCHCRQ